MGENNTPTALKGCGVKMQPPWWKQTARGLHNFQIFSDSLTCFHSFGTPAIQAHEATNQQLPVQKGEPLVISRTMVIV